MSTLSSFGGGSGGNSQSDTILHHEFIMNTGTWIPPYDGIATIYVIGAGGSGCGGWDGSLYRPVSGGGAGGLGILRSIPVTTSDSYTITIGAGGAAVGASGGNSPAYVGGNSGGSTAFVGGAYNVVANGGNGGGAGILNYSNYYYLGALGGTASGGHENYQGGNAGDTYRAGGGVSSYFPMCGASGGGAVSFGKKQANGQLIRFTTNNSSTRTSGAGGSTGLTPEFKTSVSTPNYTIGYASHPLSSSAIISNYAQPITTYDHPHQNRVNTVSAIVGQGGRASYSTTDTVYAQNGGLFAGGGGCLVTAGSKVAHGGSGGLGGGGGAALAPSTYYGGISGSGGDGVVIVVYEEYA